MKEKPVFSPVSKAGPQISFPKCMSLVAFFVIITVYYGLGPSKFPDYPNYVRITADQGWLEPGSFAFEYGIRLWLALSFELTKSANFSVNLLVVLLQAGCFIWILWDNSDDDEQAAKFWAICAVAPIALTTTLRTALTYFFIYEAFKSKGPTKYALFGCAILFHDSSLYIISLYLLSFLLVRVVNISATYFVTSLFGVVAMLAIAGEGQLQGILADIGLESIGVRAAYFENSEASIYKTLTAVIITTFGLILCSSKLASKDTYLFVLIFIVSSAVVFMASSTAAMRIYFFFLLIAPLLIANDKIEPLHSLMVSRISMIFVSPIVIAAVFFSVMKHSAM